MSSDPSFKIYERLKLTDATLLVAWQEDASRLGSRTLNYIRDKLSCREFAEILPLGFFSMTGVAVENDVAQFPESKFYVSEENKLVLFISNMPQADWHRFLSIVLDFAHNDCGVKEFFTVGATIAASSHTMPRMLYAIASSDQMKARLLPTGASGDYNFETVPGQKTALHSYMLWLAKEKGIEGANLWVPVPFYLMVLDDPRAKKKMIEFLNGYLNIGVDTGDLKDEITLQIGRIRELIDKSPELEGYFRKLEAGEGLDASESEKLAREVVRFLRK